ncbi:GNAT family N-acetyltransferase [Sphingorhabdus sp.]|uniref:GNAT family N-acetyltransferase n=1 Tax=Sphingorhabdus sp. TaxID=1902408 RepID=UPI003592F640
MPQPVKLSSLSSHAVESLLDDAFGLDRHQRTAYLLRQGMPVIDRLSFGVMLKDDLVGSIQCWPVAIGDAPLILVGPVAVAPKMQNEGFGKMLMQKMLGAVLATDDPMVMIGDPEYYGRFGFDPVGTQGWTLPGPWEPRRLLLRNPEHARLPVTAPLGPRRINLGRDVMGHDLSPIV